MRIDILTYCTGYPFEIFDRFLGTLYDTGFTGKAYVFIRLVDLEISNLLKDKYPNSCFLLDDESIRSNINNHRFLVYQQFLQRNTFDSEFILITDMRDVLFQRNIEEYNLDKETDLYFFQERLKIKEGGRFNIPWLRAVETCLHETFLSSIQENYVVCAGTTIGTITGIKYYVNLMVSTLLLTDRRQGIDQGIHNYLIYTDKIKVNFRLLNNDDNFVITVGNNSAEKLVNDEGLIININGDVSWIAHQYDRFSTVLKNKLGKKYNFHL